MSKRISQFRFKQFAVSHHRSSMKVGVDGVLIGCWTDVNGVRKILDVGTGCGLIALIMAQRTPDARIMAIDIDESSIGEAKENIEVSPWSHRIHAEKCSFSDIINLPTHKATCFDLIVSNPPYFDSGVSNTMTAREKARHQGELSPLSLLEGSKEILNMSGSIAMVIPTEISDSIESKAEHLGYSLIRKCLVQGHNTAPYKRTLLQWRLDNRIKRDEKPIISYLTLEVSPGIPTDEYRALCKDFYLKF